LNSAGELTDFQKSVVQHMVDQGYESFTSKAAAGRHMSVEKLKSLAGGRVWTGVQAKSLGLVDELGGLDKAIELAATKGKLKKGSYKVAIYPKAKSATSETSMAQKFAESNMPWTKSIWELNRWKKREGYLALMPYLIELQ
jgi:protease-4